MLGWFGSWPEVAGTDPQVPPKQAEAGLSNVRTDLVILSGVTLKPEPLAEGPNHRGGIQGVVAKARQQIPPLSVSASTCPQIHSTFLDANRVSPEPGIRVAESRLQGGRLMDALRPAGQRTTFFTLDRKSSRIATRRDCWTVGGDRTLHARLKGVSLANQQWLPAACRRAQAVGDLGSSA